MSESKFIVKKKAPDFSKPGSKNTEKGELHSRNRHQGLYDFNELEGLVPELKNYAKPNHNGEPSLDFANPEAVRYLNAALLKKFYGVKGWDIPIQYLCPPIPSRADYIHHIADILAVSRKFQIPRGPEIKVLDIGVGANCIYPIIGNREYGWKFVGSDVDPEALKVAQANLDANPEIKEAVELRLQKNKDHIFQGIIKSTEQFDITMCNPPFHSSAEEAEDINLRKWRNLGKAAVANFSGTNSELWCEGGELAFITRMIRESTQIPNHVQWFTAFVSKEMNMPEIYVQLKQANVLEYRTIHMSQGQKKSRFVAWTFIGGKTRFVSS